MKLHERRETAILPTDMTMTKIWADGRVVSLSVSLDGSRSISIAGVVVSYHEYRDEAKARYRGVRFECVVYSDPPRDALDVEGQKIVAQLQYYKRPETDDDLLDDSFDPLFYLSTGNLEGTFPTLWELAAASLASGAVELKIEMRTNASMPEHQKEGNGDSDLVPINEVKFHFCAQSQPMDRAGDA